jgi:putative (di)nucleoside polyphosphate hydrolase
MTSVIDEKGYRECVGIILMNHQHKLLLAKRTSLSDAWQFPQGGIYKYEHPEQALYRELWEEIGLKPSDVRVLGKTQEWLTYELPESMIQQGRLPLCRGQKQQWFLLELLTDECNIFLENTRVPEFNEWRWVDYWYPLDKVVFFKREVYRQALQEFAALVLPCI